MPETAPSIRRLASEEIRTRLKESPGWRFEDDKLHKEFIFKNFQEAFGFMASAALAAESMNHHPDWSNSYKKVLVNLTTHEVKGVSERDFELAKKMDHFVRRET